MILVGVVVKGFTPNLSRALQRGDIFSCPDCKRTDAIKSINTFLVPLLICSQKSSVSVLVLIDTQDLSILLIYSL